MARVLVTGGAGFIGRHLCQRLSNVGHAVVGTSRSSVIEYDTDTHIIRSVSDLGPKTNWGPLLEGMDCVVHLAARVHVMKDIHPDPLAAFRQVNVEGTERLLRQVAECGVKRFVFLSSIKVHGDVNFGAPFRAADTLMPADPYGQSKLEAEVLVRKAGEELGIETVIIRPPLVYGAGVGGNFFRMLQVVERGYPLPFGRVNNKRSLVSVNNLCDLIRKCIDSPAAVGGKFLVSDSSDISTADLIRLIANSMGKPSRLVPVPMSVLRVAAGLLGRRDDAARLLSSLQVDIDETMRVLNWRPPVSLADGIRSTVTWYEEQKANG